MTDQRSSPSQMSNAGTRMRSDPLLAEGMGEEVDLGADAGAGNAGQPTAPQSPLVPEEADVDDWDGMDMDGPAEGVEGGAGAPDTNPQEVEIVPLDALSQSDAANDNWDDNDDNPYNDSDDALPDDGEEAALDTDLLNTTERGRFGDADPGPNRRSDEGE